MKNLRNAGLAMIVAFGLLVLFVGFSGQVQAENPPSCSLNPEISVAPNGVTFYPVCENVQDDWATLQFGDGSEVDLQVAESGEVEPTSHFYSYEVGGLRTYTASLLIDDAAFRQAVEIDDRQEPSVTMCSLAITQTQLNSFEFQPLCESDQDWLELDFGDGAYTMFPTAQETVYLHSYAYTPQGVASYTVTISLDDSPLLTETVVIDDRNEDPIQVTCVLTHAVTNAPNGITFIGECQNVSEEWAKLDFGDGDSIDLPIWEDGSFGPTSHFYEYEVDGLTVYTATLEVEGSMLTSTVMIDNRDFVPNNFVFLPFVGRN